MGSGYESKPGQRSLVDEMHDRNASAAPAPGKRTLTERLTAASPPTMLVPRKVAGDTGGPHGEANAAGEAQGGTHVPAEGPHSDPGHAKDEDPHCGEAAHASDEPAHASDEPAHASDEPAHAPVRAPVARFLDLGRVATVPYGERSAGDHEAFPHAFTDGGQTKTVKWAGGGGAGARGNQGAGTVQKTKLPVFFRGTPKGDAYIREGTGDVDVVRSWSGIADGDQGNGHFVTAAAAARINLHETLHVANSKTHYDAELQPLLDRVSNFTIDAAVAKALADPPAPRTIPALQKIIDWRATITRFKTTDEADNKGGGTVDTNDLASGTYPVDAGPGTVLGKNFTHRVRTPSEPNPPP